MASSMRVIKLHTKDHEEILNVIDRLRSEGISRYIGLPQLIVCGDQSSGKSSVLEAISGIDWPRKDTLCTRFATELILRKASTEAITVSIIPDDPRSPAEKERLQNFKPPTLALENFADIIQRAGDFMGIGKNGEVFSKDVLRVEIQGPTQLPLTLVDLPGLYHAPDESQDEEGVEFVQSLVTGYMKNSRSVILAVVSAKSEIALQKVTALTRKVDPRGARTLGIITKPDELPRGSDMERSFYELATNSRARFNLALGWHVLKNRDYEERHLTLEERRISEKQFLSTGIWTTVPLGQLGIEALRPRLSTILRDHILSSLPDLIHEAQVILDDSKEKLLKLGQGRPTLTDQRRYLFQSSERFTFLINNAVNGVYYDPYFGDAMSDQGYEKRLRAVVQNGLISFSDTMRDRGQSRKILEDSDDETNTEREIDRSSFISEVQQRMRRSRGCELPGTFNPLIVGELFYLHTKPWKPITASCIELLVSAMKKAVSLILHDTVDDKCYDEILRHIINPKFDELESSLRSKADELLAPQQRGHPITYNHDFTTCIQDARGKHLLMSVKKKLREFFSRPTFKQSGQETHSFNLEELAAFLSVQTETDLERFACSEATDCMLAYYKVARKKFVDDFGNLAIEECFLKPLSKIFTSHVVDMLPEGTVEEIATEDENSRLERRRLEERVTILQSSLQQLHRLDRYHLPDTSKIDDTILNRSSEDGYDEDEGEEQEDCQEESNADEMIGLPEESDEAERNATPEMEYGSEDVAGKKSKRRRHPSAIEKE